jgi:hypothetical protein
LAGGILPPATSLRQTFQDGFWIDPIPEGKDWKFFVDPSGIALKGKCFFLTIEVGGLKLDVT